MTSRLARWRLAIRGRGQRVAEEHEEGKIERERQEAGLGRQGVEHLRRCEKECRHDNEAAGVLEWTAFGTEQAIDE